jgi:hypothetical protein
MSVMFRRGLAVLLTLAAIAVVVPSAALSRSARQSELPPGVTVTFSVAASPPNTYTLTITVGQAPLCTFGFQLSDAARQAGVTIDSATPTEGTLTVTSNPPGFGVPGQVDPGQSVTVTFHTTQPIPVNSGAELGILLCGSQTGFISDISGPTPPPAPPPPPVKETPHLDKAAGEIGQAIVLERKADSAYAAGATPIFHVDLVKAINALGQAKHELEEGHDSGEVPILSTDSILNAMGGASRLDDEVIKPDRVAAHGRTTRARRVRFVTETLDVAEKYKERALTLINKRRRSG